MDAMRAAERQAVVAETNGSTPIPDLDYEDEVVTQYPASEFSDEEYEAEGISKRRKKTGRNLDRCKSPLTIPPGNTGGTH